MAKYSTPSLDNWASILGDRSCCDEIKGNLFLIFLCRTQGNKRKRMAVSEGGWM